MFARMVSMALLIVLAAAASAPAHAQSRKPTARETAAIRDCAVKDKDNLDDGEQQCLFKLVAEPCIGPLGSASDGKMADCYTIEGAIWDGLLNDNYKKLLATLDDEQTAKARAMQRAWIAYRDSTCQFYDDKIQGSMSIMMHAACNTRETARRAMLLDFFSRL
jgi:uncharacterized protein YecT (DUF1311 family)